MPLEPGIGRMPPLAPIVPPNPRLIQPDIGERLNEVRGEPIDDAPRDWNESPLLPLIREGMKPPNLPA